MTTATTQTTDTALDYFAIADEALPCGHGGHALADDIRLVFSHGEGSHFHDNYS